MKKSKVAEGLGETEKKAVGLKDLLSKPEFSNIRMMLLGFIILGVVLVFLVQDRQPTKEDYSYTPSTTMPIPDSTNFDNELRFGTDFSWDYKIHNFNCGSCCWLGTGKGDIDRPDFYYVSNCEIDFYLKADSNRTTQTLIITATRMGVSCRQNDILVDGEKIGSIYFPGSGSSAKGSPSGSLNWYADYKFNVSTKGKELIDVIIQHHPNSEFNDESKQECIWGHDIYKVRLV